MLTNRRAQKCPLCRSNRTTNVGFCETIEQIQPEFQIVQNEAIGHTVERIAELNTNPIDSIAYLIMAEISANPTARILLLSDLYLETEYNDSNGVKRIKELVNNFTNNAKFYESNGRRKINVDNYNDKQKHAYPMIVLMDISHHSNTAQGLDLFSTTLTIMIGHARNDVKLQLLMRACRMGKNRGPAKKIVSIV